MLELTKNEKTTPKSLNLARKIEKRDGSEIRVPHEIDAEVDAQLNEELVHLTQIGGIAVRVEKSRGGHRVSNVDGDYLGAPTGR